MLYVVIQKWRQLNLALSWPPLRPLSHLPVTCVSPLKASEHHARRGGLSTLWKNVNNLQLNVKQIFLKREGSILGSDLWCYSLMVPKSLKVPFRCWYSNLGVWVVRLCNMSNVIFELVIWSQKCKWHLKTLSLGSPNQVW